MGKMEQIATTQSSAAASAKGILILVKERYFDAYIERAVSEGGLGKGVTGINKSITSTTTKNDIFNIYPNPANNSIFIKFNNVNTTDENLITLIDLTGKVIITKKTNNTGIIEIDSQNLSNGVYFVKLTNATLNIVSKVVITH